MTNASLQQRLRDIGRMVNVWDAQPRMLLAAGAIFGLLWLLTLGDLLFRFGRAGRVTAWLLLVALVVVALWWVAQILRRRHGIEAVAARIERTFPQLDNHLINYIQFSARPGGDALQAAYLAEGIPGWSGLDLGNLRDLRGLKRGAIVVGATVLMTAVTALWSGPAWGNSLVRILNPFSTRSPGSLAHIEQVLPGDGQVVRGQPAILGVKAEGKEGQPVSVEILSSDDKPRQVRLGQLKGIGLEEFSHRVTGVSADFKYRFLAGDAESETYTIRALPPLALKSVRATVTPPAYTDLKAAQGDPLKMRLALPSGSRLELKVEANRALSALSFENAGQRTAGIKSGDAWTVAGVVTSAAPVRMIAKDEFGFGLEMDLPLLFIPDQAPVVKVISPAGRALVPPGIAPKLQWEATDDHGVALVTLEEIGPDEKSDPVVLATWKPTGHGAAAETWTAEEALSARVARGAVLVRVVALDRAEPSPNRSLSRTVRFESAALADVAGTRETTVAAAGRVNRLVELQKKNLARTIALAQQVATASADAWKEPLAAQQEIRMHAGQLLNDPTRPLGAVTVIVKELHGGLMEEALRILGRVGEAPAETRPVLARQAVEVETRILDLLTRVDGAMSRVDKAKQVSGLIAFLEGIAAGQDETLASTRKSADTKSKVGEPLVERQDRLAGDVQEFVRRCRLEGPALAGSDAAFGQLITQAADTTEQQKIQGTMLKAAELLEAQTPVEAVPHQTLAVNQLRAILASLNAWRTEEAAEREKDLQEALAGAKERLDKLKETQSKIVEALRQTSTQQKNRDDKAYEEIEQEIEEIKANMQESLLKIANDLHIFPELPVGNDLVADVTQIYEEVKQVPGSEAAEAKELGLQKEDWILKALEAATERIDDMEMWMMSQPDATKRLTENFDKQELPQIPVIPMASEMEDIIGDLLEQQEDIKDKSDDSATNQGSSDFAAGWGIADGEFANFSAKGKSGNEAPDHKEQDGRSLVGREGMADGETTAGSGKINEGDKNIEARRTQDSAQSGEVQEEGHAQAKATGGGKQGGFSEQIGMAGTGPRRDTNTGQGSMAGLQAMLRRNAEALYAKASLLHIRTGSLDEAVEFMRLAEDGMKKNFNIREVQEYQRRAIAALRKTQMELGGQAEDIGDGNAAEVAPAQIAGGAEEAPARYKDLVSEYFKSLTGDQR